MTETAMSKIHAELGLQIYEVYVLKAILDGK